MSAMSPINWRMDVTGGYYEVRVNPLCKAEGLPYFMASWIPVDMGDNGCNIGIIGPSYSLADAEDACRKHDAARCAQ